LSIFVERIAGLLLVLLPLLFARDGLAPSLAWWSWVGMLAAGYTAGKVLTYPDLRTLRHRFNWRSEAVQATVLLATALISAWPGTMRETLLWLTIVALLSARSSYVAQSQRRRRALGAEQAPESSSVG
ncbi:MAG: hypothetical protein ACQER1_06890, partial [Armatimonadota bacterium]